MVAFVDAKKQKYGSSRSAMWYGFGTFYAPYNAPLNRRVGRFSAG
jgi:hypothetical protein